jgi:histidinol phosphatase-like enzyme
MLVVPSSCESMHADQNSSSVQQRAVLLDRDGVINVNHGYVHHPENFEIY